MNSIIAAALNHCSPDHKTPAVAAAERLKRQLDALDVHADVNEIGARALVSLAPGLVATCTATLITWPDPGRSGDRPFHSAAWTPDAAALRLAALYRSHVTEDQS